MFCYQPITGERMQQCDIDRILSSRKYMIEKKETTPKKKIEADYITASITIVLSFSLGFIL